MKLIRKVMIVSLLSLALGIIVSNVSHFEFTSVAEASSLKSTVKSNSTTTLQNTVDTAGKNLVNTARDIGVICLVALLLWMGYSLFIKKTADGLAEMKERIGLVCLAIAFIFFTEKILGALFGIFGYTIQ